MLRPNCSARVAVRPVCAGAVGLLPVAQRLLDRRAQLEAEELVDRAHRAHRVGDQVAVVDVEETVLADARPGRDGVFHTRRAGARRPPAEPVQVALRACGAGKIVDTMLAYDGTTLAGSRCVMTKRTSG